MAALSTLEGFVATPSALTRAAKLGSRHAPAGANLDADSRDMLSVFGRTLFLLSLGTVAVVGVTGQVPLFFLPLGLFILFGSALQWTQRNPARLDMAQQKWESDVLSGQVRGTPPTWHTDTA